MMNNIFAESGLGEDEDAGDERIRGEIRSPESPSPAMGNGSMLGEESPISPSPLGHAEDRDSEEGSDDGQARDDMEDVEDDEEREADRTARDETP